MCNLKERHFNGQLIASADSHSIQRQPEVIEADMKCTEFERTALLIRGCQLLLLPMKLYRQYHITVIGWHDIYVEQGLELDLELFDLSLADFVP
jgi:hypothetical protein